MVLALWPPRSHKIGASKIGGFGPYLCFIRKYGDSWSMMMRAFLPQTRHRHWSFQFGLADGLATICPHLNSVWRNSMVGLSVILTSMVNALACVRPLECIPTEPSPSITPAAYASFSL